MNHCGVSNKNLRIARKPWFAGWKSRMRHSGRSMVRICSCASGRIPYNWIQRNYTIIIPPTSQLWRWWCLGGVRPKSLAKRKEDEDTSRHFSGGDASYIQENSWLLVIEAYEILKSGVHPWVNRSTLFTNSLRFAHPQRCHQVSLSPSNKSSSTNHSSCSHPPGRWPSAWTPRWIGCRAGPNWRQSRCGAVVLAGTHPYFQRLKR